MANNPMDRSGDRPLPDGNVTCPRSVIGSLSPFSEPFPLAGVTGECAFERPFASEGSINGPHQPLRRTTWEAAFLDSI